MGFKFDLGQNRIETVNPWLKPSLVLRLRLPSRGRDSNGKNQQGPSTVGAKNPSSSSLESTLRVCVNASLNSQGKETNPQGKPSTAPVPPSQVLSKVKDFLGVISEANARLQLDAKDNSEMFDIEALAGNESQVIEMDLMLGIADLHTPEAVAAAESAMAGYQPVIPLAVSSIDSESDDSSDEDNDCDEHDASDNHDGKTSSMKLRRSGSAKDKSSIYGKEKSKQRPKIVDMDVGQ